MSNLEQTPILIKKPDLTWQLRYEYGEIIDDIHRIFLQLPPRALNSLLSDYGDIYGYGAESYARNTYYAWKRGRIQVSGVSFPPSLGQVPG